MEEINGWHLKAKEEKKWKDDVEKGKAWHATGKKTQPDVRAGTSMKKWVESGQNIKNKDRKTHQTNISFQSSLKKIAYKQK